MKLFRFSSPAALVPAVLALLLANSCAMAFMAAPMGHEVMASPVLCRDKTSTADESELRLGIQAGAAFEYDLWDAQLKTGLQWAWGSRVNENFALNGDLGLDGWLNYTGSTTYFQNLPELGGLGGGLGAQAGFRFLHGPPDQPMFIHGPEIQYSWEGGEWLAQRQALAGTSLEPSASGPEFMNLSPWGHTLSFLYSWEIAFPSRDGLLVTPGFTSGLILSDVWSAFSASEARLGMLYFSPVEASLGVKLQSGDTLGWIRATSVISFAGLYFGAFPKYSLDLGVSFRL